MYSKTEKHHIATETENAKQVWVVVANRTEARIFEQTSQNLLLINKIEHSEGRALNQELKEGKPGLSFSSWSGSHSRHPMGTDHPPHEQDAIRFSQTVYKLLHKGNNENLIGGLILVAEPHFLGLLLFHFDSVMNRLVKLKLKKDLGNLSDHELNQYFLKKQLELQIPVL